MNLAQMRRADRWLGAPVCFLLTCLRRVFRRPAPRPPEAPGSILFVKLAEQGSTVLAQAAMQAAIRRVGKQNVYFLLFAENRPILDVMDLIPAENIIAINARGIVRTIVSAVRAVWKLRRARIDAAVDLEFFARASAALCYLSGARWRAGYHAFRGEASYRGDLMTQRLSFNPYLHTAQTFEILVEALDQPSEQFPTFDLDPPPLQAAEVQFRPKPEEVQEVRSLLKNALGHEPSAGVVLFNPNASDLIPLRRWPTERYLDMARRFLRRYPDACIAFTGAPGEAEAVARLAGQVESKRCVSLAGKTSLRQLLVLYGLADVLVTNDSGPAHFATLTPIEVVVLFGPETPRLFAASSPRTHPLWAGLACSPCINAFNDRNSPCRDNVCMQRITVEQVLAEVCRLYELRHRGGLRRSA
ncbi:MAG TPA: glycosyltransferase family 9 protein [Gemmataceae bacterium]|nr:glycosyltransferase family 9 protein [Gemmataceae bacterium]